MNEQTIEHHGLLRETDQWMKRLALYGPVFGLVFGFFVGFGSGVLTASMLYRDHEKRIEVIEKWHVAQEQWDYDRALDIEHLDTRLGTRRIITHRP